MSFEYLFGHVNDSATWENAEHNTFAGTDPIISGTDRRRLDYKTLTAQDARAKRLARENRRESSGPRRRRPPRSESDNLATGPTKLVPAPR